MATFMLLFTCAVDALKGLVAKPQGRCDARSILEDVDRYRNLSTGVAIVSFFVSAGCGVVAFFIILDSALWAGVTEQGALFLVAISWVLIFPIWVLMFLFIRSVLDVLGIKDVRSVFRDRLKNLTLSREQVRELHDIVASRPWRHGPVFESVIADLTSERSES
ncbi:MAG: hypothetical protein GY789_24825 [Hyphomicrobiales bacterium]|nr:hypothetical protein [Hyphomicrobiales bacterium]